MRIKLYIYILNANLLIISNLKKLRRESKSGEYIAKLLSWSLYNAEWKDDVLKKILDLKSGNDNLSKVVLHQVFKKSTHLLKFLLYNDWKSSDDDPIEYRHILRICLPLWMVKSAIIVRFIKLGIKAEGIKLPPSQICAFISEASVTIILNLMLSDRRYNALYWLSDFIRESYIGSTIQPFPLQGINYCRLFAHMSHAIMHIKKKFHNCRQQVLYDHMAKNLEDWCLLVFVYLNKYTMIKDLRKVEDNFIAGFQPNMNRKGRYRNKARCTVLARVEYEQGKFCVGSSWRRKLSKLSYARSVSNSRVLSGRLSKFVLTKFPNKISYNLCKIMDEGCELGEDMVSVSCFFGSPLSDITSYDSLYHKYGKATVLFQGSRMSFISLVKRRMFSSRKCSFILEVSSVKRYTRNGYPVNIRSLDNMSIQQCLQLFKNRNSIKNKLDRALSARNLKGYLKSKFGFLIADVYRTSLPANLNISKKSIGVLVRKILKLKNIDSKFAAYVSKRISLAKKYGDSIRDILDNSNCLARNFSKDEPQPCSCDVISALGGKAGKCFGHMWIKGEDVKDSKVNKVMTISANSKPLLIKQEKEVALKEAVEMILKACLKDNDAVNVEEGYIRVTPQESNSGEIIGFVTVKDVLECGRRLKKCAVSFRDKNRNSGHIACGFLFWKMTRYSYIEDEDSYAIMNDLSEQNILESWENWYLKILKCSIPLAPKWKWCISGYGCIIFKDKDMHTESKYYHQIRARTVIKAAHEGKVLPMKPALQVGNACLFFCMSLKKHQGMWMKRCQDLVEDMNMLSSRLRMVHGNDSQFYLSRYDIDTFFPSIDCSALRPAIDFFVEDRKFENGFWVHKKNKKWIFTVKPQLEECFHYISVAQLKMLIDHEIQNGFFLLGKQLVLKQLKGISIGGHLSSALAILLANYAEHMALTVISGYPQMYISGMHVIGGLRITDDGLLLVTVNKLWPNNFQTAAIILNIFVELFMFFTNRSLLVLFEDYSKKYEFLENIVVHHKDSVYVRFHVKNFDHIRKYGCQKVKKGAAKDSATSANVKINTLMSTFFRIRIGSSFDDFCKCDALKYIYEVASVYDWPRSWLMKALYKTASHKTQVEGIWSQIIHIAEEVRKKGTGWLLEEIDKMEESIAYRIFGL